MQIYTVVLNDSDNLACNTFDLCPMGRRRNVGIQDFVHLRWQDYNHDRAAQRLRLVGRRRRVLQDFVLFGQHYNHHN